MCCMMGYQMRHAHKLKLFKVHLQGVLVAGRVYPHGI